MPPTSFLEHSKPPRSPKGPSMGSRGRPGDDDVAQKRSQGRPRVPGGADFCHFSSIGDQNVAFAKLLPRLSESSLFELLGDPGGAPRLFLAPRGSRGGVPGGALGARPSSKWRPGVSSGGAWGRKRWCFKGSANLPRFHVGAERAPGRPGRHFRSLLGGFLIDLGSFFKKYG